ncbi:MAG: hypothetical protein IPJ82_02650 [Lewinellaceae bacterium]|nr:hypothetical protein [Lewinellaceae bacterium]
MLQPVFRAAFLLSVCFFCSCIFYQRYPLAYSRLPKINTTNLTFYLLDAAHPRTRVWHLSEAEFLKDKMTGFLVKLDEQDATEVAVVHNRRDARYSRDEVLMFVKPKFVLDMADTATVTIPYTQLEKVEVYEVNAGKSVGVSLFMIFVPIVGVGIISDY